MKDTKPLLIETSRGLSVKYRDKHLYSKYAPSDGVNKLISQSVFTEQTIYIIPSPLLGYGLDQLKLKLPTSSIIILLEIDEFLMHITNEKYNPAFIKDGFDFIKVINEIDFSLYKKCVTFPINGAYALLKKDYDRLTQITLNQLHNYWKNRYTLTQMGQLWTKNCLKNLKNIHLAKPINQLKTEKPVVIVGAGQSLESTLVLLNKRRDFFYILCVDTALQVLLEVDIIPDAVLALEAQFYNLPDFYGAKDRKIDLIYDLSSYPDVLDNLLGDRYYTTTKFSNSSLLEKIKDEGIISEFIPPLGSVGITAIYIGMNLTESNIFLTGLDFSYTRGKTHSKGTPYHKTSLITWNRLNPGDSYGACLKRPLIDKLNKNGLIENTDSILYEYSLHAKELLHGTDRIFDLTQQGMDLGIKLIDTSEIDSLLNIINYSKDTIEIINNDGYELFRKESKKISNAIKVIEDIFNGVKSLKEAIPYLNSIDYLFDHYPEKQPLDILTKENLPRYYYTIRRFYQVIKE